MKNIKKYIECVKEYKRLRNEKEERFFTDSYKAEVYLHNCRCEHASINVFATLLYTPLILNDHRLTLTGGYEYEEVYERQNNE